MLLASALGLFYVGACSLITAYFQATKKRKMVFNEKFFFLFWILVALSVFIYGTHLIVSVFFQPSVQTTRFIFSFIYILYGFQFIAVFIYLVLKLTSKKWLIGLVVFFATLLSGRMLFSYVVESELIWKSGEPFLSPLEGPVATYQVAFIIFVSILICFLIFWFDFKKGIISWGNLSGFYSHSSLISFAAIYLIRIFYLYENPWILLLFHLLPPYLMYLSRKYELQ
jgi:hypothetical protein